ncbi:hypothetical protein POX_d05182 [Penicillium oxalicum]|uniref:hypothetical protein n=1 Tax=Penicillium oxalicum TaxID=69781 RepID=UPI0020B8B484|nr:hypothetical protein POX_d05182 [Penicillium oxalicum]KAI2789686.1 hypothetical protein POX_d05182 [Penicillium oxalicum]
MGHDTLKEDQRGINKTSKHQDQVWNAETRKKSSHRGNATHHYAGSLRRIKIKDTLKLQHHTRKSRKESSRKQKDESPKVARVQPAVRMEEFRGGQDQRAGGGFQEAPTASRN